MPPIFIFALLIGISPFALASNLSEAESFWRQEVARTCQGFPSKDDCDDGDSVLFNGLLCMVGEQAGCDTVRASQDADGRFWRSPRRNPGNLGEQKSFSRDQTLGVLLYLVKTQDQEAALRWLNWIDSNRYCSIKKPFSSGCSIFGYRVCRDADFEICDMRPGTWALFKRVWEHLGLPISSEMRKNASLDVGEIEVIGADTTAVGYELHLKAVSGFLRLALASSVSRTQMILKKLYSRQPMNPFFNILIHGPSEELGHQLLQLCPKPSDSLQFRRFQWAWERATEEEAWRESMGWDCIFMARLLDGFAEIMPWDGQRWLED